MLSAVSITIGAVSYFGFQKFIGLSNLVVEDVIPRNTLLTNMDVSYQKTRIEVRTLGLAKLSAKEREKAIQSSLTAVGLYEKNAKQLEKMITNKEEKEIFQLLQKEWRDFKEVGVEAITLAKVYDESAREKLLEIFLVHCPEAAANFQKALDRYNNYINNEIKMTSMLVQKTTNSLNITLIVISSLGVILGLFAGILFSNKIVQSVQETLKNLTGSSRSLFESASHIATTSQNLSTSTVQQDTSLQESSSSLKQISAMVNLTAENAKISNDLAHESLEKASVGKESVDQVISSIDTINRDIDLIVAELHENNEKMEQIGTLITSIDEKTKLINDIVFQTKLLSFNASVEAARAGNAGSGFAVVAQEVGKLAQMSGEASIEIEDLVKSTVSQVHSIIKESEQRVQSLSQEVKRNVHSGSDIANNCGSILVEILDSVTNVSTSISEISRATDQQSRDIIEIQDSISQVDSASKDNTSIARNASQIAKELQGQVSIVNNSIYDIEAVILGKKAA